jgi:hypothetical protein
MVAPEGTCKRGSRLVVGPVTAIGARSDSNLTDGASAISYTFNALGSQMITIADIVNSTIVGNFIVDVLPKNS